MENIQEGMERGRGIEEGRERVRVSWEEGVGMGRKNIVTGEGLEGRVGTKKRRENRRKERFRRVQYVGEQPDYILIYALEIKNIQLHNCPIDPFISKKNVERYKCSK